MNDQLNDIAELMYDSIDSGNIEEVKKLLDAGVSVQITYDYYHTSPLHTAACNDQFEIAKLLIERGADIHMKTEFGYTPLYSALSLSLSLKETDERVKLTDTMKLLIEHGADIHETDARGLTILMHAAGSSNSQNIKMIKILIDMGLRTDVTDDHGNNLIHLLASKYYCNNVHNQDNQFKLIELFLSCGVDMNAKNNEGLTPLAISVKNKKYEIVRFLIDCGGKFDI